jgi:hypothetical protein
MAERHLIDEMQVYVDGVVQQAKDRMHDLPRTIDNYWDVRRPSSASGPTFALSSLILITLKKSTSTH